MVKSLVTIALAFCCTAYAQKPAEIGIVSDNDLYTSPEHDQYYTNGFEIFYRYLGNTDNPALAKKITEFRAGQYIYNPQSVRVPDINLHDRPYAGYLFGEASVSKFYTNESVLKYTFQAGVLGPESKAEQVQEGLHNLFGYHKVQGWEYQIQTTLGLQAAVFYSKKIFASKYKEKVDFHLIADANVGTIWVGASAGVMARISFKHLLLPVFDSNLYGAALNQDKEARKQQREFYLYLSPVLNYQNYDATIQGSMFKDGSPVTFPLIPFRFNAEAGVKYRRNNWSIHYAFNYRGKELSNNVITGYYYGSIGIGYFL